MGELDQRAGGAETDLQGKDGLGLGEVVGAQQPVGDRCPPQGEERTWPRAATRATGFDRDGRNLRTGQWLTDGLN